MNVFEIAFNKAGNTVFGNYSIAEKLYAAKPKMFPDGWIVTAETHEDANRLIEHVQLFHNCLETIKAWQKVCQLSDCQMLHAPTAANTEFLTGDIVKQSLPCGLCYGTGRQSLYEDSWPCPACQPQQSQPPQPKGYRQ